MVDRIFGHQQAKGAAQRRRGDGTALVWNPIVAKELRSRMRGWHALALLTGYLCVIGAVGYVVYSGYSGSSGNVIEAGAAGSALFRSLALAVMASVAPGGTRPGRSSHQRRAGATSFGAAARDPSHRPGSVLGTLDAALALVALLVLACAPLFSVAFLLGGIAPVHVLELLGFALVVTLCLGSLSMFASVAPPHVGRPRSCPTSPCSC